MLWASIQQTWEPFVLVIGLLLIGHIAASDGIFEAAGSRLSHLRGGPVVLFVSMMILTALVTATLNLDTSVVFLTPVLLSTARQRSVDEKAFLYGSIFMANASSLLLLGSNLTNVLVFSRSGVQGTTFTRTMLLPWLVSVVLTTAVVLAWRWRALSVAPKSFHGDAKRLTLGPGLLGIAGATILMLALSRPAVPVLAVGLGVVGRLSFLALLASFPAPGRLDDYLADSRDFRAPVKRHQQPSCRRSVVGQASCSSLQSLAGPQPWTEPHGARSTLVGLVAEGVQEGGSDSFGVDLLQNRRRGDLGDVDWLSLGSPGMTRALSGVKETREVIHGQSI
jgi:hypothetical protein